MTKYGPIKFYQDGMEVTELVATPGIADHTGWRGYSLYNVTIIMAVERDYNVNQRFFADIKCVTRFPEFGHDFKHNSACDMPPGQAYGQAKVDACAIALNFEKPHDTNMEVEFNMGVGALAMTAIPIKYPTLIYA